MRHFSSLAELSKSDFTKHPKLHYRWLKSLRSCQTLDMHEQVSVLTREGDFCRLCLRESVKLFEDDMKNPK